MKAVDTNIVLRLILNDDTHQSLVARRIFRSATFVPVTVVLETRWVLASVYSRSRSQIADALSALITLPTVVVDDVEAIRWAIDSYRDGADLEDALHLTPVERIGRLSHLRCRSGAAVERRAGHAGTRRLTHDRTFML